MTVRQAFKGRCMEFPGRYRPVYQIAFDNNGEMEETEFSVAVATAEEELDAFFSDFCRENGIRRNSVISITCVWDEAAGVLMGRKDPGGDDLFPYSF